MEVYASRRVSAADDKGIQGKLKVGKCLVCTPLRKRPVMVILATAEMLEESEGMLSCSLIFYFSRWWWPGLRLVCGRGCSHRW